MKKVVLIFGLIAGAILSGLMLVVVVLTKNGTSSVTGSELLGYSSMVLALSAVFFGIKSYRDNHLRGSIKFWKATQVGLFISLVAAVLYAGTWEVYRVTQPEGYNDFIRVYTQCELDKAREKGATEAELAAQTQKMQDFWIMYQNPVIRFGLSMSEMLPVGVAVTLISAGLLRRKEVLPAV